MDNKMTVQQFGQLIKQKYPAYKDKDDTEVAQRVLMKYPVYQDKVSDFKPDVSVLGRMMSGQGATQAANKTETKQPEEKKKGILRKVADFFTSSEQGFGKTVGEAGATLSKDFKKAKESQAQLDDMNVKLGEAIISGKKQGKDTTRLEKLYKENTGKVFDLAEIIPSSQKTTKQIAGEALGVAADIASAGTYGKAAQGATSFSRLTGKQITSNLANQGMAKTAGQAFLRYGTQAAKEGAVLGGVYGASEAMKADKSIGEVLKDTATSAAVGGVLGLALGGLSKKNVNEMTINKTKQKARELYAKGLRATKEKYKEKTAQVIPWLLEEKKKGTLASLAKKADEGIALAEKEYEKLGELKGIVSIDGLLNTIDDEMKKMLRPDGSVLSIKETQYKTLQSLKDDLQAFITKDWIAGENIYTRTVNQQKLRELAQDYGADLYETRKSQKTISDSKTLSQIKKVDSKIRELLNKNNPTYAEINEMYHLNTTLKEILDETMKRENSGVMSRLNNWKNYVIGALGLGIGGMSGQYLKSTLASLALVGMSEVANSTWWLTTQAVKKEQFVEKVMRLSAKEMSKVLRYISANGERAFEEFINDQETEF